MTEYNYVDWFEAWYKTICPHCGKTNWHCNGYEADLSNVDVDSIKCWRCERIYLFGDFNEEPNNTAQGMVNPTTVET